MCVAQPFGVRRWERRKDPFVSKLCVYQVGKKTRNQVGKDIEVTLLDLAVSETSNIKPTVFIAKLCKIQVCYCNNITLILVMNS